VFAYRCEIDFRGSYFAELISSKYQGEKVDLNKFAEVSFLLFFVQIIHSVSFKTIGYYTSNGDGNFFHSGGN
jgi:hypothetical protein